MPRQVLGLLISWAMTQREKNGHILTDNWDICRKIQAPGLVKKWLNMWTMKWRTHTKTTIFQSIFVRTQHGVCIQFHSQCLMPIFTPSFIVTRDYQVDWRHNSRMFPNLMIKVNFLKLHYGRIWEGEIRLGLKTLESIFQEHIEAQHNCWKKHTSFQTPCTSTYLSTSKST